MTNTTDVAEAAAPVSNEVAAPEAMEEDAHAAANATAADVTDVTEDDPAVPDAGDTESAVDGGAVKPPRTGTSEDDDLQENPLAFLASRRVIYQLFGTLLILGGIVTIGLTVGLSTWNRHQQDAETAAF